MLPALLRLSHQKLIQEFGRWLVETGHEDVQPAHSAAIQALVGRPEGERLTALAQTARITKQSMGALVDHLEQRGYVERVADPDDGRAQRVRLTAKGRGYAEHVRGFARKVESDWARRVGARRVEELRRTLSELVLDDG